MRLTYGNKLGGVPRSNIPAPEEEKRYSPIRNSNGDLKPLIDWRLYFKNSSAGGILPEYNLYDEQGEFERNDIAYAFRDIRLVPIYDENDLRLKETISGINLPGRWDLVADLYLYLRRDVIVESQGQSTLNETVSGLMQSDILLASGQLEYNIKDCNIISSTNASTLPFSPNLTVSLSNRNQIEWYYKFSVDEIEGLGNLTIKQKSKTTNKDVELKSRITSYRTNSVRKLVPLIKRGTVPKGKGVIPESGEFSDSSTSNIVTWDGFTLDSNETIPASSDVVGFGAFTTHHLPITQNIVWQTIWKTWMGWRYDEATLDPTNPRLDDSSENGYYDGILLALEADGFPLKSDFASGYYLPKQTKWLRVSTRLDDDGYENICRGKTNCVGKLPNDDCSRLAFTLFDANRRNDLDKYTLISKDTTKFYPIPGKPCYQGLPATYDALIHYEYTSSKDCFDGKVGDDGIVYGSRVIKYENKIVSSSQVIVEWENIIRNSIDKTCECIEVSVQNPPYIDPNDPNECDILHTDTIFTICPDDGNYYYENKIVPPNSIPSRLEIRHIDKKNCYDINIYSVFHRLSFEMDMLNGLNIIKTSGAFNNIPSMSLMYTSSIQGESKKYFTDIVDGENNLQFSLLYAHVSGSGSLKVGERDKDTTSKINYSQYKLFTNDDASAFSFYSNGILSPESEHIYIMKFDKDSMKDRIDAGNLQISISEITNPSNTITLIDTSQDPTNTKYFDESPYYSFDLVSGSLLTGLHSTGVGTVETNTSYTTYGKIYPNMGIIIFDANKFVTNLNFGIDMTSNVDAKNELILFNSIKTAMQNGYSFFSRNTFKDTITNYFIRVPAHHANYSNNPTYSYPNESGRFLKHKKFAIEPVVYITTVGLYDDQRNLVAIGKLSKPIKKTMETELLFDIRLSI